MNANTRSFDARNFVRELSAATIQDDTKYAFESAIIVNDPNFKTEGWVTLATYPNLHRAVRRLQDERMQDDHAEILEFPGEVFANSGVLRTGYIAVYRSTDPKTGEQGMTVYAYRVREM